jgi:hypothetical protein
MKFKAKTILAKLETTYGTDPTPAGADCVQTKNLQINPYQGNTVTRDLDRETLGGQVAVNVNPHVEISFDVELAGSGTAGTAPAWGKILEACGFASTVAAGVSVTYKPVSDNFKSLAIYYLQRNDAGGFQQQKILGCRGTVSFRVDAQGLPVMSFRFLGFYDRPTDVASIAVNRSAFIDPVYVSNTSTTFTIGAYNAKASAFSLEVANNLAMRLVTGDRYVSITDRNPTGSATIDAPALGTFNVFQLVESHNGANLQAVKLTHGTLAGNIVEINAPKAQFSTVSPQDADGELAYSMNMAFVPNLGNDEISIVVK